MAATVRIHSGTLLAREHRAAGLSGETADADLLSLVRASKAGDQHALNDLLSLTNNTIRAVARRVIDDPDELADVVQMVRLRLLAALGTFDESRRFGTWLYRVTINCAIDHVRKLRRHAHLSLERASQLESPRATDPEQQTVDHERTHCLRRAAARLPKHQAQILLRHELDGLSVGELAAEYHRPVSAVRWHLAEARRKLRRELRRTYRPAALRTFFDS